MRPGSAHVVNLVCSATGAIGINGDKGAAAIFAVNCGKAAFDMIACGKLATGDLAGNI